MSQSTERPHPETLACKETMRGRRIEGGRVMPGMDEGKAPLRKEIHDLVDLDVQEAWRRRGACFSARTMTSILKVKARPRHLKGPTDLRKDKGGSIGKGSSSALSMVASWKSPLARW